MRVPLEITFHGISRSEPLEDLIREKVTKLEKICNYMVSCRVTIEQDQARRRVGNPFAVRIDMRIPPGHELVARQESGRKDPYDQLPTVIRKAFDAARRQLQELVERQQGFVKSHPEQEVGAVVIRLLREEGYGFIKTTDGQEIYFHQNSVLNKEFDRLEVGTGVRFTAEMGEDGLQASTVQIVDKPGGPQPEVEPEIERPLGWQP